MEELRQSKKATARMETKEMDESPARPAPVNPRVQADDCSCICQQDTTMSGIHSAHKKM